jgi:hypothetical protein
MVRFSFLGNTGAGKTLLATKYIIDKYKEGYKVYCNYHLTEGLIDYTYVDDLNFTKLVDNKDKNIVVIDEIGEIGRGIKKYGFERLMAQSRKSIGEEQIFIIISQVKNQQSNVLLSMIDYILKPKVLDLRIDGKPAFLIVWVYEIKTTLSSITPKFLNKSLVDITGVCDYYNHEEILGGFKDTTNDYLLDKYKGFIGSKGMLKTLSKHLEKQEGFNKTQALEEASYIIKYDKVVEFLENG